MELVPIRARDCACPGTPHEGGDVIYVPAKPTLEVGLQTQVDMSDATAGGRINAADLQRRWLITYARLAAVGWNLTDADGQAVPFSADDLLADYEFALAFADKVDDLYREVILRPLGLRPNGTSQTGPTNGSTSRTPRSIRKPRGSSSPATSAASG